MFLFLLFPFFPFSTLFSLFAPIASFSSFSSFPSFPSYSSFSSLIGMEGEKRFSVIRLPSVPPFYLSPLLQLSLHFPLVPLFRLFLIFTPSLSPVHSHRPSRPAISRVREHIRSISIAARLRGGIREFYGPPLPPSLPHLEVRSNPETSYFDFLRIASAQELRKSCSGNHH